MRYADIQDIQPIGAREDILDLWCWAQLNPDRDIPIPDAERWTAWRAEMEELQPRAAEAWAMMAEAVPSDEALRSGEPWFPSWYGEWWVEVLAFQPWSERLAEAIEAAEARL